MCGVGQCVNHILTGEQRRTLFPNDVGIVAGAAAVLKAADLRVTRDFHTTAGGDRIFHQTIRPAAGPEPGRVLVWLHGYTAHADMDMQSLAEVARQDITVVMFDLPAHGRSDGMLCYTPDWWELVGALEDAMDAVVEPMRSGAAGPPRKVFLAGHSLGGGLTACLAVRRPTFFDGLVLVAPMLCVADEVKPPWIVQQVFRRVLGPFKLTWTITPSNDISEFDFRVPEQGAKLCHANPLSMKGLKPRLATAEQLAFVFPDWMAKKMSEMKTPFLILHGSVDKVTDPMMSQRLRDVAPVEDKTLILYDGACHCELTGCNSGHAEMMACEFSPEQIAQTEQAIKDMANWIRKRS